MLGMENIERLQTYSFMLILSIPTILLQERIEDMGYLKDSGQLNDTWRKSPEHLALTRLSFAFSTAWSEGREPRPEIIQTCGLEECARQGKTAIGWDKKYGNPDWHLVPGKPYLRKGIGVALVLQGTAIPYLDMGGASIKINEDGSFNLLVGATDLGTGSGSDGG
jgi:hypothetical protein